MERILFQIFQIFIGLFLLGLLVTVHELGHFLIAKLNKIRVLAFSIGFGKPLFKKQYGETEYRISAIPFGGYVHMAGENPEEKTEGSPDEFASKSVGQRAAVAVAGPAANYVFSIILLFLMFVTGVEHKKYLDRPVVGAVADSSAAHIAGIESGDSIVSFGGREVETWQDINRYLGELKDEYNVKLVRHGEEKEVNIFLDNKRSEDKPFTQIDRVGLYASFPARIGDIQPDSPAEKMGLEKGDMVKKINGEKIYSWFQLSMIIAAYDSTEGHVELVVQRGNSQMTVQGAPRYNEEQDRFLLGVSAQQPETRKIKYGIFPALKHTFSKAAEYTVMIFDVLGKLFSKDVSPKQLAGPVGIIQMSGVVAFSGLAPILTFMALIGINLAVINLFPLIITDGGVILFLIIEAIRGKPISYKKQILINKIAIAFFIFIFIYVTFNDLLRIPKVFKLFSP